MGQRLTAPAGENFVNTSRHVSRWAAKVAVAGSALLLCACAALPSRILPAPSLAAPADPDSALARVARRSSTPATHENASGFRILPDAEFALEARLALIAQAERSIDVQYYLLSNDEVGVQFLSALRDATDRGVRVRLLLDDLHVAEDAPLLALASRSLFEVRVFNPLPARGGSAATRLMRSLHDIGRLNRRMHNKLLVADGVASVSGGRNIAAEYFMRNPRANFVDLDVLAIGPAAAAQAQAFDRYWNSDHAWPISQVAGSGPARSLSTAAPAGSLSPVDSLGQRSVGDELRDGRLSLIWAAWHTRVDAPTKIDGATRAARFSGSVSENELHAIEAAQHSVFLVSPYFLPGEIAMDVLKRARARGVEATVVTNSFGATDEPLVHPRYTRYRSEVLDLGVDIYEISPALTRRTNAFGRFGSSFGRLHSKLAVVDERWFCIGSMNLDGRSASVNTESALVIDSPELIAEYGKVLRQNLLRSAYQVRKKASGGLEWVEPASGDGSTVVHPSDPHAEWPAMVGSRLLSLFVLEEWL
jgi:cardiolipin synthase C